MKGVPNIRLKNYINKIFQQAVNECTILLINTLTEILNESVQMVLHSPLISPVQCLAKEASYTGKPAIFFIFSSNLGYCLQRILEVIGIRWWKNC